MPAMIEIRFVCDFCGNIVQAPIATDLDADVYLDDSNGMRALGHDIMRATAAIDIDGERWDGQDRPYTKCARCVRER